MLARRVLIVDDHAAFRAAAAAMLDAQGWDVVGSVASGEEAVDAVGRLVPDLVLVDFRLPGVDGVTVAEELSRLAHPPDVILVSSREDAATEPRVLAAPVRGFLPKRALGSAAIGALLE